MKVELWRIEFVRLEYSLRWSDPQEAMMLNIEWRTLVDSAFRCFDDVMLGYK